MGVKVKTLLNGWMNKGRHDLSWDGTDDLHSRLPDGIYCLQVVKNGRTFPEKIILQK
jgi:flagellar hook assembly protein FlgD